MNIDIDIVILYYNNPHMLRNCLTRLYNHTDYIKFKKSLHIIIADTGTPLENIKSTTDVVSEFNKISEITYFRINSDEIRSSVLPPLIARPASHVFNVALYKVCKRDIMLTCMIGQVFVPKYFSYILAQHMQHPNAVILPKRFDLFNDEYHIDLYDKSFETFFNVCVERNQIKPSRGLPDVSCRREHLIAVGGWDLDYKTIAPIDMDICSRLTGKLDNGMPSEWLYPNKGPFKSLGLEFVQPYIPNEFFSLVCNTYKGHISSEDRNISYENGIQIYLNKWGVVQRNSQKEIDNIEYEIIET